MASQVEGKGAKGSNAVVCVWNSVSSQRSAENCRCALTGSSATSFELL